MASKCKDCTKKESHEYYLKNKKQIKDRINEYRKKYPEKRKNMEKRRYNRQRLEVLIHYGGNPPKCACCKEDIIEFLTIDHINNDGVEHRKMLKSLGANLIRWIIKNSFPEGFQILCYNCNCGREKSGGVCPHRRI